MEENIIIMSQMQFMNTVFEFSNCFYKEEKNEANGIALEPAI